MVPVPAVGGAYAELSRPANAVAAGVLTFTGAYVAGGALALPVNTIVAVVATVMGVAAGNAINDYFDRAIDAINAPDRPIPRGAVTPRGALAYSVVLLVVAVVMVLATLPVLAIGIALFNVVALVTYTEFFKGTPGAGNALVAYLVGSTFLFGGAAVGDVGAAGVLFVLAALATFAREVVKDVEDMTGDAHEDLTTLPIAIGTTRALVIGLAALVIAVLVSPAPYLTGTFGLPYLVVLAPAVVLMLHAARTSFTDPTRGQALLKYAMFIAAAAFVVGRLTA